MKRFLALAFLGWLLPAAAWAADGDPCAAIDYSAVAGRVSSIRCAILLDDKTGVAASGGPIIFDMATWDVAGETTRLTGGLPDQLRFVVSRDNDCTIGTVTITHSDVSGGVPTNNFVAGAATTLDVDTSSPAGATDVAINVRNGRPIGRYISASWSGITCAGGFDINIIGYENQTPR
jgi:hypothetical protein